MTMLHKQSSMFAGAITPMGFVDYFSNIMPLENAQRRYFIKGSSGAGKSTFIKEIAQLVEEAGHEVTRFYCSNDASSLDGMACPVLGLGIIDATRPHMCDPEMPGAVDEIIDFGAFLDREKLLPYKAELLTLLNMKKTYTEQAFSHMARVEIRGGVKKIPGIPSYFLSAVTPDGYVSFADGYFTGCQMHTTGWEALLERGARAINFCSPFAPEQLDYLYFPDQGIAFELGGEIPPVREVVQAMYNARQWHMKLEEIYGRAMDFDKLQPLGERIIKEIL